MQSMSVCRSHLRHLVYPHVVNISGQLRKQIFRASVHVVLMIASELYRRGTYRVVVASPAAECPAEVACRRERELPSTKGIYILLD